MLICYAHVFHSLYILLDYFCDSIQHTNISIRIDMINIIYLYYGDIALIIEHLVYTTIT